MDGTARQQPEPGDLPDNLIHIERRFTVGPWLVSGTWSATRPGSGPLRLVIQPKDDATSEDTQRGLTSGALRSIESAVVQFSAAVANRIAPAALPLATQLHEVTKVMESYKGGKTPDTAYYTGLLALYDAMVATGDKTPVQTLSARLERKPETIRTQLKKARKLAAESTEGES